MKAKKLHKKWIILLYYDDTDSHTYIHKHTNSPIERGQERTKRGKMKYKMRPSQVWRTPSSRWKAMMCKLFNGIFRSIFKWLTHTQTYEKNISHCVWKTENAADLSDLCVFGCECWSFSLYCNNSMYYCYCYYYYCYYYYCYCYYSQRHKIAVKCFA